MEQLPFDKRSGKIWFNNELVEWQDARVHVISHGMHYASLVFEGIRIYNKKIFYIDAHLERLKSSLQQINIAPSLLEEVDIIEIINRLIDQNNYDDYFIYVHISRGVDQKRNHIYSEDYRPTILIMGENYVPFNRDVIINGKKQECADFAWCMSHPFNMLGKLPVLSVPSGFSSEQIPTGIQIISRSYSDELVFQGGYNYEMVDPWLNSQTNRPIFD